MKIQNDGCGLANPIPDLKPRTGLPISSYPKWTGILESFVEEQGQLLAGYLRELKVHKSNPTEKARITGSILVMVYGNSNHWPQRKTAVHLIDEAVVDWMNRHHYISSANDLMADMDKQRRRHGR